MINESGTVKILVKPNSMKNEILGYDKDKKSYRVSIKEKAEDNKANKELIRFLSKTLKKRVSIISGLRSKNKLVRIDQKD